MDLLSHSLCTSTCRRIFAICVTALFCVAVTSQAQTPGEIDLRIETPEAVARGDTAEVHINVFNSSAYEIGGLTLGVSYDTLGMTFIDGTPTLGICPWFSYNVGEPTPGLVIFVGVTELVSCSVDDIGNPILTLRFAIKQDAYLEGYRLPLEFVWFDCNQNQLSDNLGITVLSSDDVYRWFDEVNSVAADYEFPTIFGVPSSCGYEGTPGKIVNFYSGDILVGNPMSFPNLGDVNLNGIGYEIADAIVLGGYLRFGTSYFTIDVAAQLARSDANADLRPGTLADYVYLQRVIRAQAARTEGWRGYRASLPALVTHHLDTKTIEVDWADSVVAVLFRFSGSVEVTSTNVPHQIETVAGNGNTTVLFLPTAIDLTDDQFAGNIVLSYSGDGILTECQLADLDDRRISVQISQIPGNETICGDVLDDGGVSLTDAVAIINHIFGGDTAPIDLEAADADCSGAISVSDAIIIINYLFAGGAGPCSFCN